MHYYKRNLGDYAKKAGRLSMLQHGSYTLLIDACYDREQFPTRDEAIDWTWASSTAEVEAVDFVLAKFFVLEDGRYVQTRIREELAEYQEKAATNKRIADERETKRKQNITNRAQVVNEPPPNHKPITNNHKPITKGEDAQAPDRPSMTGAVCMAMKAEGMAAVNPSHPELPVLIDKGADIGLFASVARECVEKKKPFAYALAMVAGRMADAAALAATALSAPISKPERPPPESFEAQNARQKRAAWEAMTGQTWPDDKPKKLTEITGEVIDITPIRLTA